MLKQRLLTAAMLIPLVVAAILWLPTSIFNYLILVVIVLASIEWLHVVGIKTALYKVVALLLIASGSLLSWCFMPTQWVLSATGGLWFLAMLLVVLYAHKPLPEFLSRLLRCSKVNIVIAMVLFTGFSLSANVVHQSSVNGPLLLLYSLVTVWLADTGGYFAGKRFGRHKLATEISPNKTWEGVAGAIVLSSIWACLFYLLLSDSISLSLPSWLLVNTVVVLFSIVGDLFESVFKRQFHVKDSGNLLPGHGGILDRIDSLVAAVPVFTIIMIWLGAF